MYVTGIVTFTRWVLVHFRSATPGLSWPLPN